MYRLGIIPGGKLSEIPVEVSWQVSDENRTALSVVLPKIAASYGCRSRVASFFCTGLGG